MYQFKDNIFTNRELEVLALLVKGQTNPQIANALSISVHTVKSHLEHIYAKLGVFNRIQASVAAVTMKIV